MSTNQQLQQDIQNELVTANQLLRLISLELHQIKQLTSRDGEFVANVIQADTLMQQLANMQHINLLNLPPVVRTHIDLNHSNQNMSYEQHETFRDESSLDHSQ